MITIVIGTNRPGSATARVAGELAEIYHELGENPAVVDLGEMPPEVFLPTAYEEKPVSFLPFVEKILKSDGLVVVTPEYNGGLPGVLKYFIDMLPFPESFERRPVCFVGLAAGMWGALRPVEQLQAIFGYRNAHLFPPRVFLPGIGSLLNEENRIADPKIRERLKKQATGFLGFVEQLKSA